MPSDSLNILVIGAHPDDCDVKAGGIAAKYTKKGHDVRFVSVTNGDAGHHEIGGVELARRRRNEAQAAANVIGIEYQVLDNHDGELEPTLKNRKEIIRLIRNYNPDLILTHRPNDYHPDHRYTSQLVQDSAYMVTVPNICTDTDPLRYNPVIAYLSDGFQRPYPFKPDVVIDIDDVIEKKIDLLHCHKSQFYEWLAWNSGDLDEVPDTEAERREWLKTRILPSNENNNRMHIAKEYRSLLIDRYGEERGKQIQHAEAFEGCEYGSPLTEKKQTELFPF